MSTTRPVFNARGVMVVEPELFKGLPTDREWQLLVYMATREPVRDHLNRIVICDNLCRNLHVIDTAELTAEPVRFH